MWWRSSDSWIPQLLLIVFNLFLPFLSALLPRGTFIQHLPRVPCGQDPIAGPKQRLPDLGSKDGCGPAMAHIELPIK